MRRPAPLSVLITGCSSGIGHALAAEFARRGHRVFASARRPEAIADLPDAVERLRLDVTDEASIAGAVAAATARAGRLDVVVNNAGFGLMGPVAELDPVALRRQFDTNVVGAVAVIRAVVPGMVRQGSGCIVNVGSVSGLLPTPFAGAYCASKAALHALTDALRLELAPFGIRVVSLQPGGVASRFGEAAGAALGGDDAASLYAPMRDAIRRRAATSQEGAMDAAAFARRVVDAVTARTPPAVLRVGTRSKQMPLLRWLLPVAVLDRILARRFGLAGRGAPGAGK